MIAVLLCWLFSIASSFGQVDTLQLNHFVWKSVYGASQADNPSWLLEDSDGDGFDNSRERASGTNPFNRGSGFSIQGIEVVDGTLRFTFPTLRGKRYSIRKTATLSNPSSWQPFVPPVQVAGTGMQMTLTVPISPVEFYQVLSEDIDTDGDGAPDWAEFELGLDPLHPESNGEYYPYGRPLTDGEFCAVNLAAASAVTVSSAGNSAIATQPLPGRAASDLGSFTITRGGFPSFLGSVTVNLGNEGGATSGVDYVPMPLSVVMSAGVRSVSVPLTPLQNPNRHVPAAAGLTVLPGSGYTVGAVNSAGVTILPSGSSPNGTGLRGAYFNNAYALRDDVRNFAPENLAASRTDAAIDFNWNSSLPAGVNGSSFAIRWTGQIQPAHTETYYFEATFRQGCVLKIGGQTIIQDWSDATASARTVTGSIALLAGIRYDLQLEYFSNSGAAASETHLRWYSESQPSEIVPMTRLFPVEGVASAAPAITSPSSAYAFAGQPFSFQITTSSHASTNIAIAGGSLPAGLSFTQASVNGCDVGQISGVPSLPGTYSMVVTATSSAGTGSGVLTVEVRDSTHSISREIWTGLSATPSVADIPVNTPPSTSGVLAALEDNVHDYGNNFGERIRGYLTVPVTGYYYFWVSSSGAAELWISNDEEPCNKVKRCSSSGSGSRLWSAQKSQKSGWLQLNANTRYYVEVLHKVLDGSTNALAVGYTVDPTGSGAALADGSGVIPGHMISKYYPLPISGTPPSAGTRVFIPPAHPSPGFVLPVLPTNAEASRFLTQATFGPNATEIGAVKSAGFEAWINSQVSLPPTHLLDLIFDSRDVNNRYPDEQVYNGFWRNAVTAEDQLRQRVAFALSEIFVVSSSDPSLDNNARALASFYDVLVDGAFSNFSTLLKNVTLHPAMGEQLDMRGSRRGELTTGTLPNENFAGMLLRLFTVGTNRLWPDGTQVLDSHARLVPAYDQGAVKGFARVFTGWNYQQPRQGNGRLPTNFGSFNDGTAWVQPMTLFPSDASGAPYHELGAKKLLDLVHLPAATITDFASAAKDTDPASSYFNEYLYDRNGLKDLDDALAAIFHHPNVGPFVCRQLIQRLVTSHPSPGYVFRVVQAFNGERTWNGQVTGVRGDLKEVIKAILLDYEARSSALVADPKFGKQREPILRVTAPARFFLSRPVAGTYTQSSTYNATTNPFPHRMRIDITGDLLIGQSEWSAIRFKTVNAGGLLPISTYSTNSWYWTRTAPTFVNGAAPRTNPSFYVDAFGVQGATYNISGPPIAVTSVDINTDTLTSAGHGLTNDTQIRLTATTGPGGTSTSVVYFVRNATANTFQISTAAGGTNVNITSQGAGVAVQRTTGNLITVTSIASVQNNSAHSLKAGGSVYLKFFGTGAPAAGIYTIASVPSTTVFTVAAPASGTIFGQPAAFTRQANCSYTPNADHSVVNVYSPVPHGLTSSNEVYIVDNAGTALPITGRYPVTIPNGDDGQPDPYRFIVNASGTGSSTLPISNVTIFPLIPPALDRSGSLEFHNSTWLMNRTDQDSTTASLGQTILNAPSVFNFFPPDYQHPGALAANGLTTPEFSHSTTTGTMLLTNFIEQGIQQSGLADGRTGFRSGSGAIVLDLSPYMTAAYTANAGIGTLVDDLNRDLMGGTMSVAMRDQIVAYVASTANFAYTTPTATQMRDRVRAVVHLIITSAEFAIQR